MILKKSIKRTELISLFLVLILTATFTICGWQQAIASPLVGSQEEMGAWETIPMAPPESRMQSVHTVLLPNGKVLSVNGSSFRNTLIKNDKGEDVFIEGVGAGDYDSINNASLFDPKTKQFERIVSPPAMQYGESNDLFCAGHLQLADGNVLFISGTGRYYPGGRFTGSRQANIYNWKTGEWSPAGQLKEGRWYPTLVSLVDGKIVIFSGLKLNAPNQINPSIEIYDPKSKKFHYIDLTEIDNSPFNTYVEGADSYDTIDLYPRVFPTADGRLLITGDEAGIANVLVPTKSKKSYLMSVSEDEEGKLSVSFEVGPERFETSKAYGTAIQVPNSEDVLLIAGMIGTNDINFGRGGKTDNYPGAKVASSLQRWVSPEQSKEKNGKWETVEKFLDKPRANVEAVILPSKEILVANGGEYPEYKPIYEPVLMTPNSQAPGGYSTKSMNSAKLPRLYHNGAILLPDARVLTIGGNGNRVAREKDGTLHVDIGRDAANNFILAELTDKLGQAKEFSLEEYYKSPQSYFAKGDAEPFVPAEIWQAEIFSPPYLFKPGSRPEIVEVPSILKYSQLDKISVKDATQNGSLVLVKLGAETHSFDFGQRLVELPIEKIALGEQSEIDFKAPKNPHLYPPGYYMIFYLNDVGKPSHAKMVKLEATA
ncbi:MULTISPECIES: galactose oxidase early set domain-containing protein [unclassified Microcoleus]|uniref:galactose oxidase early set domain-containing protein n=1 Tax=unclassified Microcoleus TaxID=2642155 RepID=UPI002FCFD070